MIPDAGRPYPGEADGMASMMPVVVYPPDADGGRRMRVDGEILGRANGLRDIAEFLRRVGIGVLTRCTSPDPG